MRTTVIASLCVLLGSCSVERNQADQSLVAAAKASLTYATRDEAGVDLENFHLSSVVQDGNGHSNQFIEGFIGPDERALIKKLRGKHYWQACYTHKDPGVAGATYCYFLNRTDLKLLAVYRLK